MRRIIRVRRLGPSLAATAGDGDGAAQRLRSAAAIRWRAEAVSIRVSGFGEKQSEYVQHG
jgi:hypothetical protein